MEVVFLNGVERFVPADVVIVHVDLSVVPDEYLEFARRYPVALNGEVRDIRKSTFSRLRVDRDSDYAGTVIVKSNLNHAGEPERRLGERNGRGMRSPTDYRMYKSVLDVPDRFFDGDDFIVERFMPELDDHLYHVRTAEFLGDRLTSSRLASTEPIVNDQTQVAMEKIEPHPAVFDLQRRLKLDYAKLDYVVHDEVLWLLDVNKTPGAFAGPTTPAAQADRRNRAEGIYSYLR
jgi:hypothetical protein